MQTSKNNFRFGNSKTALRQHCEYIYFRNTKRSLLVLCPADRSSGVLLNSKKMAVFNIPNGSKSLDEFMSLCNSNKAVVDFYVAEPTIPFYFKVSFMAHYQQIIANIFYWRGASLKSH